MIRKSIAVVALAMLLAGCRQNVAPEPAADITSFTASPAQVETGAEVAFAWELADNGAVTVGCTLTPAADAEPVTVDCDAGSYVHVYETAGEMTATLTVLSEPDYETSQGVTVTVTEPEPEPEAPLVEDDELTVDYDSLASFDLAAAVLANDEPGEGALVLTGVSGNEHVVFDEATGKILIDPAGALELDSVLAGAQEVIAFDYTAANGAGLSASATVSLSVSGTAQVNSISFDEDELRVIVEVPEPLELSFETHGNPDRAVNWSFDPEGIAGFDDDGNLVGIAVGETVLTAQSASNEAAMDSISLSVIDPLIIDIDTSLIDVSGPVAENQFYLFGFLPNGEVWVDWGDGAPVQLLDEAAINQHAYESAGEYTVLVWSESEESQTLSGENAPTPEAVKAVRSWGNLNWVSLNRAFQDAVNLEAVPADLPAGVTNLVYTFNNANKFNGDISGWDTGNVTTMYGMFESADIFNQDLSRWDTANVERMDNMFASTGRFNQDLNNWNTRNVTQMDYMFYKATSFNQDLSNWDTGNVTRMDFMFYGASSFNQDLSNWSTSNVTTMRSMFEGASAFNGAIGSWDTGNITNFASMFDSAENFNQDLHGWDTSSAKTMSGMFNYATNFNGAVGDWDTGNVTDFSYMFRHAESFNQDLNGWDTSSAGAMNSMFEYAITFNGAIGDWDTRNVGIFSQMFYYAASFNQDLSNWCVRTPLPFTFSEGSALTEDHLPVLGTC